MKEEGNIKAIIALEWDNRGRAVLNEISSNRKFSPERNNSSEGWQNHPLCVLKFNRGSIAREKNKQDILLVLAKDYEEVLSHFKLESEEVLLVLGDNVGCGGSRTFSFTPNHIKLPVSYLCNGKVEFLQEAPPGYYIGISSPGKVDIERAGKEILAFCTKNSRQRNRDF